MKSVLSSLFVGISAILIVVGFVLIYKSGTDKLPSPKACTEEAKICPDGSSVGRTGPNCEFSACPEVKPGTMTLEQAKTIAETSCIKGGDALGEGYYNENSKTWWFDANLNATKPGCNPACVVSEDTGLAEINWRCTGLLTPSDTAEGIRKAFALKYPKYSETLSVRIAQEEGDYARGGVTFVTGEAGGLFFAQKVGETWQIVHDGNGNIPCSLTAKRFPKEMLSDCAE